MPSAPVRSTLRRSIAVMSVAAMISCAGCTALSPGASTSSTPEPIATTVYESELREVLSLIAERLGTAPTVAAAKQVSRQLVTDTDREQIVLEATEREAERQDVDAAWVHQVFADQIAASKDVQYALLDEWRVGLSPAPTTAPDLATEVRPILDRITPELVGALAELEPHRDEPGCSVVLTEVVADLGTQREPAVQAALVRATAHLCEE